MPLCLHAPGSRSPRASSAARRTSLRNASPSSFALAKKGAREPRTPPPQAATPAPGTPRRSSCWAARAARVRALAPSPPCAAQPARAGAPQGPRGPAGSPRRAPGRLPGPGARATRPGTHADFPAVSYCCNVGRVRSSTHHGPAAGPRHPLPDFNFASGRRWAARPRGPAAQGRRTPGGTRPRRRGKPRACPRGPPPPCVRSTTALPLSTVACP